VLNVLEVIVGVAAKVVPTLNGVHARLLSPLWAPFVLINLGCSLRVFGQTATDFTTLAFPVAGVSGLLEVTGLALWGVHLWLIMSGRARLRPERSRTEAITPVRNGAQIRAEHTVGEVLAQEPELLDVFVDFGFTTLTNPQLRRSIARVVTIEKACRRMGVDLDEFLRAINARCKEPVGCGTTHAAASSQRKGFPGERIRAVPDRDGGILPSPGFVRIEQ
jgi:hypothetical protein